MKAILLVVGLVPFLSFARSPMQSQELPAKEILAKFKKILPLGEYEGKVPGKRTKCVVQFNTNDQLEKGADKRGFMVSVDDIEVHISPRLSYSYLETSTSRRVVDYSEDGDEVNGGYSFTNTARLTSLSKSEVKVSTVTVKEYLEEERDSETELRSCIVKLK